MRRIVVTGATGSIGAAFCAALIARGDVPVALTRNSDAAQTSLPNGTEVFAWEDPLRSQPPRSALSGADAVVNLIGEPVAQRWTPAAKQRIRSSRVDTTAMLVDALRQLPDDQRPGALISQSATGFYGPRGEEMVTEQDPAGSDFLAGVVDAWEASALAAADLTRVVVTRTGVVLAQSGGAVAKMLPFFRAGIGGPVAGGRQYVPWVHIADVCSALIFCIDHDELSGPVNVTAPDPVTNAELSRALGSALHRPAVMPVPAFALQLLYGQMAEMVTTGQRAIPAKLTDRGFEFSHDRIGPALSSVL